MCPDTILRIARLCLLSRLIEKAPMVLMSLIVDIAACDVGWPRQVKEDLKWPSMSNVYSSCANRSFNEWAEYIKGNSKHFRVQVKKFAKLRYANSYCPIASTVAPGINSQVCAIESCQYV